MRSIVWVTRDNIRVGIGGHPHSSVHIDDVTNEISPANPASLHGIGASIESFGVRGCDNCQYSLVVGVAQPDGSGFIRTACYGSVVVIMIAFRYEK